MGLFIMDLGSRRPGFWPTGDIDEQIWFIWGSILLPSGPSNDLKVVIDI
jgi:hypothetical protein